MSDNNQAAPAATESSESMESTESSQDLGNSSGQVSEEAIDSASNLSKAEKVEAKKMLRSLKIKYNGREIEEQLPFEIPDDEASRDYMTKQLQMSKLGHSKAQEYSSLEKEVRNFVEDLRKNPKKALSDPAIGLDLKQLAKQIIEEEIENSKKSPEQLKSEKLEAELKALKDNQKKKEEEGREKEFERLREQEFERYDILMSKTLESNKIPKNAYVIKKMADYMLLGLQEGKDVTPDDVLPLVMEEVQEDIRQLLQVSPDDFVEKMVGKDLINRLRKKNLARVKQSNPALKAPTRIVDTGKSKSENTEPERKQTVREFFKI